MTDEARELKPFTFGFSDFERRSDFRPHVSRADEPEIHKPQETVPDSSNDEDTVEVADPKGSSVQVPAGYSGSLDHLQAELAPAAKDSMPNRASETSLPISP